MSSDRQRPPRRTATITRVTFAAACACLALSSCHFDRIPEALGPTPSGGGAKVRFDWAQKPLPEIPLPNDVATWPDPTSRTGLRINASLVAPTHIEKQARERFSQMEGWGTFAPISVSFERGEKLAPYTAALDLGNVRSRHQGDDYDFANDAFYVIDLETGIPAVLDVGEGNFDYTLKRLDRYWPNDTRRSERNLLFDTIDETQGQTITSYEPKFDTDFDGNLDLPNFENLAACPAPDPVCDNPDSGDDYGSSTCIDKRRERDRCVADHLMTWYERQTDTLVLRPLLPLKEMKRYAVVLTNRLLDHQSQPVRSPLDQVYHATQRSAAERVRDIFDTPSLKNYYGDLHGTGLDNVAFLWSFTTQPTTDDMKRLRDGLYGAGPFARWQDTFAPELQLDRMVGLYGDLDQGVTEPENWVDSELGQSAGCADKVGQRFIVDYERIRPIMRQLVQEGFGVSAGPEIELLLRRFDSIDHIVIAQYKTPFLLEGGPNDTDPNAAFSMDFTTGKGFETEDTVQVWMVVPKATEKHEQPFDVNLYGHGYTGNFIELMYYAGNMAARGLATVGINAMGHGLVVDDETTLTAGSLLGSACYRPMFDAMTRNRARDLNGDNTADSGGDFWSSYLFHTRDGVRQSVLDHVQLVRIMRAFGQTEGKMTCRDDARGEKAVGECPPTADGNPRIAGDFDGNGVIDIGGPSARFGTWGESLGGFLSSIHGAIDPYVTSTIAGSSGGGLSDIGLRSFQGGVIEAVLLRMWGPLVVSVPASSRKACSEEDRQGCTTCTPEQRSIRWVLPDVNRTGEIEIGCVEMSVTDRSTVLVSNLDANETRCARAGQDGTFRIGIPSSAGDRIAITIWDGEDRVDNYEDCRVQEGTTLRHAIDKWGFGAIIEGQSNPAESAVCAGPSCMMFQGKLFVEGSPLTAPGDGFGLIRQTPEFRRLIGLAQAALEPGDPISFATRFAFDPMPTPNGEPAEPQSVLTLNTIGDMNVPLNSGIAFARATGALPFLRPEQGLTYPAYADYATPAALYKALGNQTPNAQLIKQHVIEGITSLARTPASDACASSSGASAPDSTFVDAEGQAVSCFPTGCTEESEKNAETRVCFPGTSCNADTGRCLAPSLGTTTCEQALWDPEDLDEGTQGFHEQSAPVAQRLARLALSASGRSIEDVWQPRLQGIPHSSDDQAYQPDPSAEGRLVAMLNAYVVPEGTHTFVYGNPCKAFDINTYLSNLTARYFESDGTDLYYLSHPASHRCLASEQTPCAD